MKKIFVTILILAVLNIATGVDGRGGGGFRSSPSRSFRSSPFRSSSPSKSFSKPKPSRTVVSKPIRRSTVKSNTDSRAYQKAKQNGKAFTNKKDAIKDFKSRAKNDPKVKEKLAKDYPTKYDKKPETRPSHIPEKYTSGGNTYNVTYQNGGYGYMGPSGWTMLTSYMLLDTMSDAMMMSSMRNNGYYVGGVPQTSHVAVVQTRHSFLYSFFCTILFVVSIVLIFVFVYAISKDA